MKKEIHTFRLWGRRNYESARKACSSTPRLYRWRGTFALKRGQKWNNPKLQFYFMNVLAHSVEEFPPSFPNARAELRDVTCFAWLHWKLVCLWQFNSCFRFAVAASEIGTVISSNSSFISFWRSFRGIFWEVLWTLKLTQSQVGIVGIKTVNWLNRINRCAKFRKRNRLLVTFVVFFTALWTFWHLIL